jgi:RNA polymerase sigma-70 factor (ECF subfamily)
MNQGRPHRAMMHTENLIAKACMGDGQAQGQLVQLWYKRIYNYCYKFFMDHDMAMEAAQKTFISMYRNLQHLKDTASFKSWLYTIAVNQCREEARKNNKQKVLPLMADSETGWDNQEKPEHSPDTPEQQYARQELANLVQQCLLELSDEQREVIIMKEFEGLKFREIAEVLHISENTAKSRLYYGLSALKKIMERKKLTPETLRHEH